MKKILISLSLVASLATVSFADSKTDNKLTEADKTEMLGSDFQMPSAGALVNALSKKVGNIDWKSLIEPVANKKYSSNEDKVLNLGVRGADAYFLNQSKDSSNLISISTEINYLLNKIQLNGKTLNSPSRKAELKALKDLVKAKNWSVVRVKISKLQASINNDFVMKKAKHLEILNNVGGWIEGYRLAVEGIKRSYKAESTDMILQDELISFLLKGLTSNAKLKSFSKTSKLIATLKSINAILKNSKNYSLTKAQVDSLSKILADTKKYI